jgi:hypothetical protein
VADVRSRETVEVTYRLRVTEALLSTMLK